MDTVRFIEFANKPTRDLVLNLMGGCGPEWDEGETAAAVTALASSTSQGADEMARIVLRCRLLDILIKSVQVRPDGRPSMRPRGPTPHCLDKTMTQVSCSSPVSSVSHFVHQVYTDLADWPKVVLTFLKVRTVWNERSEPFVPQHLTHEQQRVITGIHCLSIALGHSSEANLMTLASCLWWLSMVCIVSLYIS